MKKIISVFSLVIGFLLCGAQEQDSGPALRVGDMAPSLQVEGWLRNKPDLPLAKGRVHVVEFWATWCQPCLAGIPHLNKLAAQYADRGLQIYGISIMERQGVDLDSLRRFMETPTGKSMGYTVAADGSAQYMRNNWFAAMGERGIPFAVVVDKDGRIAWKGHPNGLDKVLPDMVDGTWDIAAKASEFEERARLSPIDATDVVNLLNPYMGKDYAGGLRVLDSLLVDEPGLRYFSSFGHFMTFSLIGTQSPEAISYIRSWWAANDVPRWNTVSDAIASFSNRAPELLTPELYLLGAEALQAQLDNYPWSMDFRTTYATMANYYEKAGKVKLAAEMREKSAAAPARR